MAHDVRIFDQADMLVRFEMDVNDKPVEKRLEKAGTYVVRCGLHKWMHAFIVNTPHPYFAITGEEGEFLLPNVPQGKYLLHIWHETLGETEMPLEVAGNISDFSCTFHRA